MVKSRIVRLHAPAPLVDRIDAVAARQTSQKLGNRVTRAAVIRAACVEYVENHPLTRATRCTPTPE